MYFRENTEIFLNGKWEKASEAKVSLYSQSLHYGIGVFEGIRSYELGGGEAGVFKVREHYERLQYSAGKMHIPFNYSMEELTEITYSLLKRNNMANAYIRPLVFLEMNMALAPAKESNLMIAAWEWPRMLGNETVKVTISPFQRPNPKSCFVDAKVTGHYINSLLATYDAKARGFQEALLLDAKGFVAEGPGANLFMEKDGKLYTPPKGNILPGITRQTIIDLAVSKGIPTEEKHFTTEELLAADGAFFTGTAVEIAGIHSIDGQSFKKEFSQTLGAELSRDYSALVRTSDITV